MRMSVRTATKKLKTVVGLGLGTVSGRKLNSLPSEMPKVRY